jgi:hypothetical protein
MRTDVITAAVTATKRQRYVPWAVCLTCVKHVYPEHHKQEQPEHLTRTLTREESEEVARVHKMADDADRQACEPFRRI